MWYTGGMVKMKQLFSAKEPEGCEAAATQSMQRAMSLIGDVWTLMIVINLLGGSRRFGQLLEAMNNVSPKTISQRLKKLEEIGMVERHAFAEIPPRVEYCLTEKGLALVDIIEAIRQFGERYLEDVDDTPPPNHHCH